MIDISGLAIRHIPFIVLGIWPINLLTLLASGHEWSWASTPQELIGLWQWGAFVSLSLAILTELGVTMFFALAERRRRIEQARQEGLEEGRKEGRAEGRKEAREARREARQEAGNIFTMLSAAAQENPELLPSLLEKYREQYLNGPDKD